jgi:hypothetical protein
VAAKSSYWGPSLSPDQFAVFHFDVKTMSMRDAEGNFLTSGNDTPLIFATLPEAQDYCRRRTAEKPALGCRILDYQGKVVQSFSDAETYDRHHGRPAAKRNIAVGTACLIAGACSVALDAWFGWRLILGVLLGMRFMWVGASRLMDGIATWSAESQ